MSDTPETDKLLSDQHHDCVLYDDAAGQLAELCEKMERERDNTRECFQIALMMAAQYKTERDEARNLADAAMWEADRLRSKLWRACDRAWKLACERSRWKLECLAMEVLDK